MSYYRRVRKLFHLKPDNRISIQQGRCSTKFLYVQLTDIIVKKEDACPSAHVANQQTKIAFPTDVPRSR
jgi:hypothetical protein